MITSQEQRDEIGLGYTTVTVTMQNGTPNILHDVDVQVWSYHLFDENTCITCSQSYTRTTLLPQEFYTVTARWNITGYFPRSEVKVAAYGVISP